MPFVCVEVSDTEPVYKYFWVNQGQKTLGVGGGDARACLRVGVRYAPCKRAGLARWLSAP